MSSTDPFAEILRPTAMVGAMWDELRDLPILEPWEGLRHEYGTTVRRSIGRWISPDQSHYAEQLSFALGRFDEGAALVRFFTRYCSRTQNRELKILDIGSGNGGVAVAMANCSHYQVHSMDLVPNADLRGFRAARAQVHQIGGDGQAIPVTTDAFDVVLLLDMVEHVAHPERLGREVMRILKPGGVCMLTTPPRLRYLFRPDPHYGVKGLLLFPNELQRLIVNRIMGRRIRDARGVDVNAYDVEHMFWHVREISRNFPLSEVEVLYNRPLDGGVHLNANWWMYKVREFFWDRILLWKPRTEPLGAPDDPDVSLKVDSTQ